MRSIGLSMHNIALKFSSRVDENESESGSLVFQFGSNPDAKNDTVANRFAKAANWLMSLDAQYQELIWTGHNTKITIPVALGHNARRAQRETLSNYLELRYTVGELVRPVLMDTPLLSDLYPYQRAGVDWLIGKDGAILADDMGLGKTVQVISAMRLLFNRAAIKTALIACPKGLLATWEREFHKWAPELCVATLTPPAKLRENVWSALRKRCHVMLTNYEQLRNPPVALGNSAPDLIVADEAHRLRNRKSKITASSFLLRPKMFWALTGTPVERDTEDLATLLSLVNPNCFSPNDADLHPSSLRSRARAYVLRRRKKEVLDQLPPVLDTMEVLELSPAQSRVYQTTLKQFNSANKEGEQLALLTRLQSVCDIDSESGRSSKADRVLELLARIQEQKEKAVIFSYRLDPLRLLKRRIAKRWGDRSVSLLLGEMHSDARRLSLEKFQNHDATFVLLASTRIGGEGLTLVEANHVFLFNQWWNPSSNDQARDRVVRIGQRRKVRVYRFCCRNTIEESLERILNTKRTLVDETVERLAQGKQDALAKVLREVGIDGLLSSTSTN